MSYNIYIYCITSEISEDIKLDITALEGEKLFVVRFKDICALVSKTCHGSYDITLENLSCHEKVSSEAMKFCTVLPLSFSTISRDEDNVKEILSKYYGQFKENLLRVEGKAELGVKIFYKLNYEQQDKAEKTHDINPREYMKRKHELYHNRKKQIEHILQVADEIHDTLAHIACESCFSKPLKNNLIFNGAYLVHIDDIESFSYQVKLIKDKYPGYKIVYSGPWSVYHFVSLIKEGRVNGKYN